MAAPPAFTRLARREGLTLQQLALRAAGSKFHWCVKGSAKDIADQLEEWFVSGAADGFNLLPAQMPGSLDDFANLVIPELQRRGLFRTEYEGPTLRQNLQLADPGSAFTQSAARRA
jgi:alkanesulfonate monooxygenase SsuD/methylene tetrahydromethanopterin reductase-like flavin-dependent oxidoreductase (luciferase family)